MRIINEVKKCRLCDSEFVTGKYDSRRIYCTKCVKIAKSIASKKCKERAKALSQNVRTENYTAVGIEEAVRESDRLGLSYGFYMAKRVRDRT